VHESPSGAVFSALLLMFSIMIDIQQISSHWRDPQFCFLFLALDTLQTQKHCLI
jgi:hypothetical protein